MRTNARPLPALAAAALLAATAVTLAGCSKAETQPSQNTPPAKFKSQACSVVTPTTVTVFVEWNGTAATTRNKTVYLCEKDSVEWVAADENTYVSEDLQWKADSPLDGKPTHENQGKRKVLHSKLKKGTAGHGFDYTLQLVPPGAGKPVPIDPRIEVMD